MFERLRRALRPSSEASVSTVSAPAVLAKRRGDEYLKAGDLELAEQQYRQAIILAPSEARSHFALGWTLREQGLTDSAIDALRAALAIDSTLNDAHYVLGMALQGRGDWDGSIRHLLKVTELDPEHEFVRRDLCVSLARAGRLDEAEALLSAECQRRPDSADLLLLSGNVRLQRGALADAASCYQHALTLNPALVEAHYNRGRALQAMGQLDEALTCQEAALEKNPQYVAAWKAKVDILQTKGRSEEASECLAHVVRIEPTSAEHHFAYGLALSALGQPEKALQSFEQALFIAPEWAEAHANRAAVLFVLDRYQEALHSLDKALRLDDKQIDVHRNRALVLERLGRLNEAEESLNRYLEVRTSPHDGVVVAADLLHKMGQPERALSLYEASLRSDPGRSEIQACHGALLYRLTRLDEALAAYDRSLHGAERPASSLNNRGLILMEMGRLDEGLASFDEALDKDSDAVDAHYNRGLCLLLKGSFSEGWRDYGWRWRSSAWLASQGFYGQRTWAQPRWSGHEPLTGKTILLHPEQGFGDTIQFCRYAQTLAEVGATVVLEVQPPLKRLLGDLRGVSRVLAVGEPLPDHDFHCPVMSLPEVCGTTLDNVPAANGYLPMSADSKRRSERWKSRLRSSSRLRIGVVWSGSRVHKNDANRSIPWSTFSRVLSSRHEFICLQNELREGDRERVAEHPEVELFLEDLTDFSETAALIANLDVVVCVDTAVAHLAGAMGKPVWLLLPANPDWRWMLGRQDSPWYSHIRMFRQPVLGDWTSVIDRVRSELGAFADSMSVDPTLVPSND